MTTGGRSTRKVGREAATPAPLKTTPHPKRQPLSPYFSASGSAIYLAPLPPADPIADPRSANWVVCHKQYLALCLKGDFWCGTWKGGSFGPHLIISAKTYHIIMKIARHTNDEDPPKKMFDLGHFWAPPWPPFYQK